MSTEDRNFKVAFLVDARRRITPIDKPVEVNTFSRGIRLSVLKLLSYFAHRGNDNRCAVSNLRWGLKVFHSYDYPPCKRDYLKELSVNNFQNFEEQLESDLEALSSSVRGKRAPKTPQVLTATSLRQALDDVVRDFQWDGPDVSSPVKRFGTPSPKKRKKSTHDKHADSGLLQNVGIPSKCVFLLMPCPVSRPELEEFCDFGPDDPVPTSTEFLEKLLPRGSSHRIMFQEQNIALFWIDTNSLITTEKRSQDVLSVISQAMQELSGCVIPANALISQTQDLTTSLQSTLVTPSHNKPLLEQDNTTSGIPKSTNAEIKTETAEETLVATTAKLTISTEAEKPSKSTTAAELTTTAEEVEPSTIAAVTIAAVTTAELTTTTEAQAATAAATTAAANLTTTETFEPSTTAAAELAAAAASASEKSHLISSQAKGKKTNEAASAKCSTREKTSCAFLPFSTIMNYYLNPKHDEQSKERGDGRLNLCSIKDGQITDHCHLEVCQLITPDVAPIASSPANSRASKSPAQLAGTTPEKTQSLTLTSPRKSSNSSPTEPLESPTKNHQHNPSFKNRAVVKAILPVGIVPLGQYQTNAVYTCTGLVWDSVPGISDPREEVKGQGGDMKLSSWFKDVMVGLSRQRNVMLVNMPHPETRLPVLAILEPLTSTTASLRILRSWPNRGHSTVNSKDSDGNEAGHKKRLSKRRSGTEGISSRVDRIAEDCVKRHSTVQKTEGTASSDANRPCTSKSVPPSSNPCEMVSFRPHLLEPWFSYCPSGGSSSRLIEQLQSISQRDKFPNSLSAASVSVSQLLQQLEATYNGRPGTSGIKNTPAKKTDQAELKTDAQTGQPTVDPLYVRQSPRLLKRRNTFNVGFRAEKIIQNSKRIQVTRETSPIKKNEKENRVPARNKHMELECPNFESEQDVINFIQSTYAKAVTEGSNAMNYVQFTSSILISFMKSENPQSSQDDPVTKARDLLTSTLLVSSNQLRDKYQSQTDEHSLLLRVQEIELQVLLRLEMESISPTELPPGEPNVGGVTEGGHTSEGGGASSAEEDEEPLPEQLQDLVDEIVKLLRVVPILANAHRLTAFLSETLLHNYSDSLPHLLRAIYSDLMQPIPSVLQSPCSDTMLSSVKTLPPPSYRSSSHGSFAEPSVSSIRTRSLIRQPSLSDMGNKRLITIPLKNVAKNKDKKEKSKGKAVKEDGSSNTKTVRRNLFMGGPKQSPRKCCSKLQRRQSVAVMQNIHRKSPRRHTPKKALQVLKTKVVKETPGKKQVQQAMLKRQERARNVSAVSGELVIPPTPMRVVEETPLKPVHALNLRRSPRIKPANPGFRRSSFYSQGSSASLKASLSLGSRIAGKKSSPSSVKLSKAPGRGLLLSEICSPEELPAKQTLPSAERFDSSSRNTRSQAPQTPQTPSKDLPGKVSPDEKNLEQVVFKTPTRTPRRSVKSPSNRKTSPANRESSPANRESSQANREPSLANHKLSPADSDTDNLERQKVKCSPLLRFSSKFKRKDLPSATSIDTELFPQVSKAAARSKTPDKEWRNSKILEDSTELEKEVTDGSTTPNRRSDRLKTSASYDGSGNDSVFDNLLPTATENTDASEKSSPTSEPGPLNLKVTRNRKRTWADRSPSPKSVVNTPSPQKPTKSSTPSSLTKWQRKKKPRRDSPEKARSSIFPKVTPPSVSWKRKIDTLSPASSPYSVRRQKLEVLGTAEKTNPILVSEGFKGTTKQCKLGKVCKANVNLLALMTDAVNSDTHEKKTRSRSKELFKTSQSTSNDVLDTNVVGDRETFTFLDSHLDGSDDDDIDFPKTISPYLQKAKVAPKNPEQSTRSSSSVCLSEDENENSSATDEVFASPSRSKTKLVTTPLTTSGLFELMNSPMMTTSLQKKHSPRSKVSFKHPTRKSGRQLYATGSKSSPESPSENMVKRSSSLGMRRLSSGGNHSQDG